MANKTFWTPEKIELVKAEYPVGDLEELAKRLGASVNAMQIFASKNNIQRYAAWSENDIKLLKKLFPKTDNEIIAKKLNKSAPAIRSRAAILKLKKANNYWKIGQEKYVLENYGKISIDEIMLELKKTKWAVINKYRELSGKRKTGDKIIISKVK